MADDGSDTDIYPNTTTALFLLFHHSAHSI